MKRILGLSAAWAGATIVAVAVAAAAVGSVRSEVADAPTALGAPAASADVLAAATAPSAAPTLPVSTTVVQPETDDARDELEIPDTTASTTSTTPATGDEPTTTDGTSKPPTTTTVPPQTTTTTASYSKSYNVLEAGIVRITVSGDSVTFAGATANPGWTFELDKSGPEEVSVKFKPNEDEHEGSELKFKAHVEDGELLVDISEHD